MISIVSWLWHSAERHPKKEIHFTADHVNRLERMLRRNIHQSLEWDFWCVTDMPEGLSPSIKVMPIWPEYAKLGGCYRRLKMFSPELQSVFPHYIVSMDIDCVVTGDITPILRSVYARDFIAWGDTHPRTHYNGSLWGLRMGSNPNVWTEFLHRSDEMIKTAKKRGYVGTDQAIMSLMFGEGKAKWGKRDGIYSFNLHLYRKEIYTLPQDAKIVFFHGRHDPSHKHLQRHFPWIVDKWT